MNTQVRELIIEEKVLGYHNVKVVVVPVIGMVALLAWTSSKTQTETPSTNKTMCVSQSPCIAQSRKPPANIIALRETPSTDMKDLSKVT